MKEKFDAAIALLRKGWTKGYLARDASGSPVIARDPKAVSWCATGALYAVCKNEKDYDWLYWQVRQLVKCYVGYWNDTCQSVDEVIAVIEKARDMCKG